MNANEFTTNELPSVLFVNLLSSPIDEIEATFRDESNTFEDLVLPLGLMYISSYLKKARPDAKVGLLDFLLPGMRLRRFGSLDRFIETTVETQVGFVPDILAVSLNLSASYPFFRRVLSALKRRWPEAWTVVGGTHATNDTRGLLDLPDVDAVLRGEGELAFTELVTRFPDTVGVEGLYTKATIGDKEEPALAESAQNLDELPYPDWDLVDMEAYVTGITRLPKRDTRSDRPHRMAEIFTSRGCPYRCTFCSSHTVHGRKVRRRSVANIVGEIAALHERFGVNRFLPEDDYFTADGKRTLALLDAVLALDIEGFELQYPNGLSVNAMGDAELEALARAGMSIAIFAIESGSQWVQKHLIKKRCDLDKATRLISKARRLGVRTRCFYILGFPGETRAQMEETIAYAKRAGADWSDFFLATPLIGSAMFEEFVRMGVIDRDSPELFSGHYRERRFDTEEISAAALNDLAYRANLSCNFISNVNVLEERWAEALAQFEDVVAKYPFHIVALHMAGICLAHLGRAEETIDIEGQIASLIARDSRARTMFERYGDLMSDSPHAPHSASDSWRIEECPTG